MTPARLQTAANQEVHAIDLGRDFHAETVAFLKSFDAERKAQGLPRILHCWNKYIEGWLKDETGRRYFCMAPRKGTSDYEALVDCWWNQGAIGGKP